MSSKFDYDLIAIGGGSGGLATVNRAASYGARTLLIEMRAQKSDVVWRIYGS